jgi:hypothetical protein
MEPNKIADPGFARRSHCFAQAGRRAQKKIPNLRIEDWGFYPLTPFTVLSSKTYS